MTKRKPPESRLLLSVCKDIKTGHIGISHINMTTDEIDWMIKTLSKIKKERQDYERL